MADIRNIFDVGAVALSAQMQRMNTTASNLANANSVSSTAEDAYRPLRPVFKTEFGEALGQGALAAPMVEQIVSLDREPARLYRPDSPKADKDGFVYQSTINQDEEMVEMTEASRQYQDVLETVSTLRGLMARTLKMGE